MQRDAGLRCVTAAPRETRVLACEVFPQRRARIAEALRGRGHVRFSDSFDQLTHALRSTTEDIDIVIVSSVEGTADEAVRTIRLISSERPHVAIVAYCRAGSQYSTDIRALAAAGV